MQIEDYRDVLDCGIRYSIGGIDKKGIKSIYHYRYHFWPEDFSMLMHLLFKGIFVLENFNLNI